MSAGQIPAKDAIGSLFSFKLPDYTLVNGKPVPFAKPDNLKTRQTSPSNFSNTSAWILPDDARRIAGALKTAMAAEAAAKQAAAQSSTPRPVQELLHAPMPNKAHGE